jgi:Ran GTPase-activating protein (RanGAP) involved in mRNA processing and transport
MWQPSPAFPKQPRLREPPRSVLLALEKLRQGAPEFVELNMSSIPINSDEAEELATALSTNATLADINFSGCKFDLAVGVNPVQVLCEAFKEIPTMQFLKLWNNAMGDDGARFVADMLRVNFSQTTHVMETRVHTHVLQSLNLGDNQIGDEGAAALCAGLTQSSDFDLITGVTTKTGDHALKRLNLSGNRIGDEGAKCLGLMLGRNGTLTTLNVSNNLIGPRGAGCLCRCIVTPVVRELNKTLTDLNVWGNPVGAPGAGQLSQALRKSATLVRLKLGNYNICHGVLVSSEFISHADDFQQREGASLWDGYRKPED